MASLPSLKLAWQRDVRRVRAEASVLTCFAAVCDLAERLFTLVLPERPALRYVDEDGDVCTIMCDAELQEALRVALARKAPTLRLQIAAASPASAPPPVQRAEAGAGGTDGEDDSAVTALRALIVQTLRCSTSAAAQQLGAVVELPCSAAALSVLLHDGVAQRLLPAVLAAMLDGRPVLPLLSSAAAEGELLPLFARLLSACPSIFPACIQLATAYVERVEAVAAAAGKAAHDERAGDEGKSDEGAAVAAVHKGVTCDGCSMSPIVGIRYQCACCDSFDLCADCAAADGSHAQLHPMLKIYDERQSPAHISVVIDTDNVEAERRLAWQRFRSVMRARHATTTTATPTPPSPSPSPTADRACRRPHRRPCRRDGSGKEGRHVRRRRGGETERPRARFIRKEVSSVRHLRPSQQFHHSWTIRNTGRFQWPPGLQLQHVGEERYAGIAQPVPRLKAGEEEELCVAFTAPEQVGRISSFWRLSFAGCYFGPKLWLNAFVSRAPAPRDEPEADAARLESAAVLHPPPGLLSDVDIAAAAADGSGDDGSYDVQLARLLDMGYSDEAKLRTVLESTGGNLHHALGVLMAEV
eukprot:PLAT9874.1.p1 GENE.PLAT9874.1~~PLAT9874.1.p1  ORF type:complete len:584 (-),score=144.04 PLAT9874.1:63-1814(-)